MSSVSLLNALTAQVWQVSAIAVLALIIVRYFGKNRPHFAHCVWAIVLIKCLIPPIWSSPIGAFSQIQTGLQTQLARTGATTVPEQDRVPNNANAGRESPVVTVELEDATPTASAPRLTVATPSLAARPPMATQQSTWSFRSVLIVIWGLGIACTVLTAILRYARFWRHVGAQAKDPALGTEKLEQLVDVLSCRLKLSGQVRLQVVEGAIGPAVFGLWRPTILLPAAIIENKSVKQIEPIIAHELVHIRRGDLWWALVQSLATAILWFHPLVWLASRMLTRESERSCDEETVANLSCSPATYARSLLDVLEKKHQLHIAPALPGVRPVDVTRNRLERIMKLGHGSHKQTPWWVWAVFIASFAIVLPGGRILTAQDTPQKNRKSSKQSEIGKALPRAAILLPAPAYAPPATGEWVNRWENAKIDVADLLDELEKNGDDREAAKEKLLSELPQRTIAEINTEAAAFETSISRVPPFEIHGSELVLFETREQIEKCRARLRELRDPTSALISIQLHHIRVRANRLASLGLAWKTTAAPEDLQTPTVKTVTPPEAEDVRFASFADSRYRPSPSKQQNEEISRYSFSPVPEEEGKEVSAARSPQTASWSAVLDIQAAREALEVLEADSNTIEVMSPRVVTKSRQIASVKTGVQRPFVTSVRSTKNQGVETQQPIITTLLDGSAFRVQPEILNGGMISLSLAGQISRVMDVDTFTFESEGGKSQTVQQPIYSVWDLGSKRTIRNGATILVCNQNSDDTPKQQMLDLIVATCAVVGSEKEAICFSGYGATASTTPQRPQAINAVATPGTDHPDMVITASGKKDAKDYSKLLDRLQEFDLNLAIQGNVDYDLEGDQVTIVGNSLTMSSPDGKFQLHGDSCRLQFEGLRDELAANYQLKGNVALRTGSGLQIHANSANFTDHLGEFTGAVKINFLGEERKGVQLSADSILTDLATSFELAGNAHFSQPIPNAPALELNANRLSWNKKTNELSVEK